MPDTEEQDRLSTLLDHLNTGRPLPEVSGESAELLQLAERLRASGIKARPPEPVLADAVRKASDGMAEAGSSRRNSWLYSGVLGAAAVLMLFFGIHGFPSIEDTAANNPLPVNHPVPSAASAVPAAAPPESPRSAAPAPPPPTPESAAAEVRAQPATPSPSPQSTPPAPGTPVSAFVPLVLPGRTPDSVFIDPAGNYIRQTFDSGKPQELILIQRKSPPPEKAPRSSPKQSAERDSTANTAKAAFAANRFVLALPGQEVTLQGRQSMQELGEIAGKLTP